MAYQCCNRISVVKGVQTCTLHVHLEQGLITTAIKMASASLLLGTPFRPITWSFPFCIPFCIGLKKIPYSSIMWKSAPRAAGEASFLQEKTIFRQLFRNILLSSIIKYKLLNLMPNKPTNESSYGSAYQLPGYILTITSALPWTNYL
jgi:hypothetical protein